MGAVVVILILALLGGGGYFVYYMINTKEKPSAEVTVSSFAPVSPPVPEGWEEPQTDHYVPQETIYSYYNPTPGISCPACDAESPAGMSYCQVCGMKLQS